MRQGDIVARHGGDEFCILAEPIDELSLQSLAQRVLEMIDHLTIRHGSNEGRVRASIGAVCGDSSGGWKTPEDFMSAADRAMYLSKSRGGNQVTLIKSLKDVAVDSATSTENAAPVGRVHNSGLIL